MIRSIPKEGIQIKLAQIERLAIVDIRSTEEYEKAHLPHAFSIPLTSLQKEAHSYIPDLGSEVVVYANDSRSPQAELAAQILKGVGYFNVYCYWGGLADWAESGLPVDGVYQPFDATKHPHLKAA